MVEAAIQINVENGTVGAKIDLEVFFQARMGFHAGCDSGDASLELLNNFGPVLSRAHAPLSRVSEETFEARIRHVKVESGELLDIASHDDACGPRARLNRLHGDIFPRGVRGRIRHAFPAVVILEPQEASGGVSDVGV